MPSNSYNIRQFSAKATTNSLTTDKPLIIMSKIKFFTFRFLHRNSCPRKWVELIHLKDIELMVALMSLISSSLKILPYLDEHFTKYKSANSQEPRSHINGQIQRELFLGTLVSKAQATKFLQSYSDLV